MTIPSSSLGITARWATFASELTFTRLPGELLPVLKGLVLDTIGVALAASTLGECCREVGALVAASPGPSECTVLGFGGRASVQQASFANGALAHALNFDALGKHGGHLGVAAVAAPLAMAERRGAVSGTDLLTAVALGAELTARLAAALNAAGVGTSAQFLQGQVLGYFGATVAAGRILGFSQSRMHSAMGLALMQAAGTRQVSVEGGPAKAIYGGFANQGAILAALLAEQGVDARCAALEGQSGLLGLFYDGQFDEAVLMEGLGQRFYAQEIAFKPWPISSIVQAYVAAILSSRAQLKFPTAAIERIQLRVPRREASWLEPAAERRRPANAATAANSIFFGIAKALCNGAFTLADVTQDGLRQASALAIADKIEYELEEFLAAGRIMLTLHGGREISISADESTPAVTFDQLAAKFRDCARYAAKPVADHASEALIARIADLEHEADVAALLRQLMAE
jgi:2-methylcitrate dehydratase PrpD